MGMVLVMSNLMTKRKYGNSKKRGGQSQKPSTDLSNNAPNRTYNQNDFYF